MCCRKQVLADTFLELWAYNMTQQTNKLSVYLLVCSNTNIIVAVYESECFVVIWYVFIFSGKTCVSLSCGECNSKLAGVAVIIHARDKVFVYKEVLVVNTSH